MYYYTYNWSPHDGGDLSDRGNNGKVARGLKVRADLMLESVHKIRIKDRLIRKEREKERCRSTQPPPSEGIETDWSLDRRPIPPTWRRVVPAAGALATRVHPPQEQSLNIVKR